MKNFRFPSASPLLRFSAESYRRLPDWRLKITPKLPIMKIVFVFLSICLFSLSFVKTCSAQTQTPQWVVDLTDEIFLFEIGQITQWEETQKTWYNINGQLDQSDSVSVNTLIVRGTTTSGHWFLGAIPVTNQALNALGSTGTKGETCAGECGCQACKFKKDDYGCQTCAGSDCVEQTGCACWCKHTLIRN